MAKQARFDRNHSAKDALARVREQMMRRHNTAADVAKGAASDSQDPVRSTSLYTDVPLPARSEVVRKRDATRYAADRGEASPDVADRGGASRDDVLSASGNARSALGGVSSRRTRTQESRIGASFSIWDALDWPAASGPEYASVSEPLPQEYSRFEQLRADPKVQLMSLQAQFLQLARALADVRDQVPDFDEQLMPAISGYLPEYTSMSNRQLRWYVTWRTRLRDGQTPALIGRSSYGYLVLLCTELLDEVGVEPGNAVVQAILQLEDLYADTDQRVSSSLRRWAADYAIAHQLDLRTLPANARPWKPEDKALGTLLVAEQAYLSEGSRVQAQTQARAQTQVQAQAQVQAPDPQAIRDAVLAVLGGRAGQLVPKGVPEQDYCAAMAGVLRALVRRSSRLAKRSFVEGMLSPAKVQSQRLYLGTLATLPPATGARVSPFPGLAWLCESSMSWKVERRHLSSSGSARLEHMARAVRDALLAEYGLPVATSVKATAPKYMQTIAAREAARMGAWRRAHTVPDLKIDRSALGGIRRAAARTRESLLVDEERQDERQDSALDEETSSSLVEKTVPDASDETEDADGLGLDATQAALLRAMLRDDSSAPAAAAVGSSIDLVVDALNERLFDYLGDTAIEFVDGVPSVVPDYADDLRKVFGI